jgi:adenylate kinase family enzyme
MDIPSIVSQLPKLNPPSVVKKPAYFILGKIGSGKTTVALELVKSLTLEHVQLKSLMEKRLQNNIDLGNQLKSGQEISSTEVAKLVQEKVNAQESLFKGENAFFYLFFF